MSGPYDRPRIYINWSRARPVGWRGWLTAIGFVAVALAVLALVAVVASTLFVVAAVVAVIALAGAFIGNLFRGRKRDVGPYRGNYDA
ncbi:MAG: hypothetical protein GC190_09050 [Alphaproteobacteria bacterium]|nr:hypothetical protein [Alphaproteobacteria bacterium]